MAKNKVAILVCCAMALFGGSARVSAQVLPTLFDMHMTGGMVNGEPWPFDHGCVNPPGCDGFAGVSLWDSAVPWIFVNPAPGVYNWMFLDTWINHAAAHGVDLLYAFGDTPQWVSSKPNDLYCADAPGTCDPPNDLRPDGTGTNEHWKTFVKAIVTHARGRIHYWEVWNEANNNGEVNGKRVLGRGRWVGTIAQMLRMAKDARQIILSVDPTAVILSPSGRIATAAGLSWFNHYFSKGGGQYADVITFHGYVQGFTHGLPLPENLIPMLDSAGRFRSILTKYGQNTKPLFDTEASWGVSQKTGLTDPDMQAGFVTRFYLIHQSENVARFYWYEWDNLVAGTLWTPSDQVDLAVADSAGNNVSVLLGYGDGTFQPPGNLNPGKGATPTSVAVADFNHDGIADVVSANAGKQTVSVFLGHGDNTFGNARNSNAGNSVAVAVADFNKDGAADLALANAGSNNISVLLGNGDGTFMTQALYAVGTNPTAVATGNFSSNGNVDLVVANGGSNNISVLLSNGDGTFQAAVAYAVGTSPTSVSVGDFNNDGKVSLVVANAGSNNISVLLGNGDGTFQRAVRYPVGTSPTSVTVGDFNKDGNMDVAVANGGSNSVSVLLGNGDGTLKGAANFNVGSVPYSIAAQDFDWDGCLDLVVANKSSNNVSVLLGNCKGGFSNTPLNSAAGNSPVSLAVGYFNSYRNNHPGTLLKAGTAYQQTYNWMVGNTMSACTNSGTIWTCDFTGPNGYQAQAVWDTSQSCSHNVCSTSNYSFDSRYVQYVTVYGQVILVSGSTVPIGYQPILLQNQSQSPSLALGELN